jgi:N-acetylmuramoyl-L-alanine amidase
MFSPLTTRTISTAQHGPRSRAIDHIILHHAASGNLNGVLDMISRATRRVSYNYVIGPGGEIVGVVNETRRSWSVANEPWDSRSITICAINSSVGGSWPVSDATHNAMARLVGEVCRRRGIPINRTRIFGHRELFTRHGAGYATACPGGLNMDRVVAQASSGAGSVPEEEDEEDDTMRVGQVHFTNGAGAVVRALYVPGTAYWLPWTEGGAAIANGFAQQLPTGSSVQVTESMFNAMARAAAALLPERGAAPATLTQIAEDELATEDEVGG